MVTPLVFNLRLTLDANGWDIEKVYGSPEADQSTGELMKVNTLFPSQKKDGETRGGMILLKFKKRGADTGSLRLRVSYDDRSREQGQPVSRWSTSRAHALNILIITVSGKASYSPDMQI